MSNTYELYRKGWKGIRIDANPRLIKKFKIRRPRDIAISALISDLEKERDFYLVQNDTLSTTEKQNLKLIEEDELRFQKVKMRSCSLTSILDQYKAPKYFDLLTIDVEEHDFNVIRSLNFNKYQPYLIVIEDETFDSSNPYENRVFNYLSDKGYTLTGFLLKNIYFCKTT